MKVCIIQPAYCTDYSLSDEYFQRELEYLDQCDESMDLIVLPKSTDIPCLCHTNAYVVRSSVSMDINSDIGGGSMVVSPEGKILCNLQYEEPGRHGLCGNQCER